jgi:hypothetical protein
VGSVQVEAGPAAITAAIIVVEVIVIVVPTPAAAIRPGVVRPVVVIVTLVPVLGDDAPIPVVIVAAQDAPDQATEAAARPVV